MTFCIVANVIAEGLVTKMKAKLGSFLSMPKSCPADDDKRGEVRRIEIFWQHPLHWHAAQRQQ